MSWVPSLFFFLLQLNPGVLAVYNAESECVTNFDKDEALWPDGARATDDDSSAKEVREVLPSTIN